MNSTSRNRGPRNRSAGQNKSYAVAQQGDWWTQGHAMIRRCLEAAGERGLTEMELYKGTGEKRTTISAALVELAKVNLAYRSHHTRLRGKVQGHPALVWVAKQEWVQDTTAQPGLPGTA